MLAWLSKACSRCGYSQLGPFRWIHGACWSFRLQVGPLILFERFRNFEPRIVRYSWFVRDPFAD
jgi:hypothetical protein